MLKINTEEFTKFQKALYVKYYVNVFVVAYTIRVQLDLLVFELVFYECCF